MEWPNQNVVPVVLNSARPARNRHRQNSEHPNRQTVYFTDPTGRLVPMAPSDDGRHRSASMTGAYPGGAVVINNEQWQELSPSPSRSNSRSHSHRRGSSSHHSKHHKHHYHSSDDSSSEEDHHARSRHRRHSHSRTPSPHWDAETEKRLAKLRLLEEKEKEDAEKRNAKMKLIEQKERDDADKKAAKMKLLEQKEREQEERERWEEEQILKEARKTKKKKEEEELRKKTIEEYELKKAEEKAKADKKKKEEDTAFRERLVTTFTQAGYSEESIEKILKKAEKKKEGGGKHKEKEKEHEHEGQEIMDLSRPTYIKVNKKHLSPDTLNEYNLPWAWDERDNNYIIIKRWIPERDQDILFEHTRKLRERRLITDTTVELKKEHNNLMLVRKKSHDGRSRSKSRPRSWLLT